MSLESGYILLLNLRFHAFHGVLEQERITGNDYIVNLKVKYPIAKAMISDDVSDTLNYAAVFKIVSEEISKPCNLLERVAYNIGERLFCEFPKTEALEINITKVTPPMGADCDGAGIELHLKND